LRDALVFAPFNFLASVGPVRKPSEQGYSISKRDILASITLVDVPGVSQRCFNLGVPSFYSGGGLLGAKFSIVIRESCSQCISANL
jgi:hypothetical protein